MKMIAVLLTVNGWIPSDAISVAETAHALKEDVVQPSAPKSAETVAVASELTVVNEVQTAYRAAGDVSAQFAQTFYDKLRGQRPTETGVLWAKTDGRVRWSYRAPTRKDFVYTGRQAFFYEPQNAQVTIFEKFEDSPLANAIRFLWGQGSIVDTFNVSPCDERCKDAPSGQRSVLLTPKDPISSVDVIQLTVDSNARVRRSVVFDPIGNRTEYAFKDIQFQATIEDKKFKFKVPPGVSIIKATGQP
ncbi:MAG: outer membrane lipoprotein carrier protein LolA [Myxococcota bacterium]